MYVSTLSSSAGVSDLAAAIDILQKILCAASVFSLIWVGQERPDALAGRYGSVEKHALAPVRKDFRCSLWSSCIYCYVINPCKRFWWRPATRIADGCARALVREI